jgi:hypothetical protein
MQFVQVLHQNEAATAPLIVPVAIVPNTSQDVGDAQIRANSRLMLPWLDEVEPHGRAAIICGGGPSLKDCEDEIYDLYLGSGRPALFGLNAAALWLNEHVQMPDYQIIIDAKEETSALVDMEAVQRIYSSQVHPETAKYADVLFHLANTGIEDLLPTDRTEPYTLVGGGVSVGITALCVAYTMGYRKFHLFGYDSSNRGEARHAYSQPMNANMPEMDVAWGGKVYRCSMPMKLQADAFVSYAHALQEAGCEITLHGSGLLPAMWNNPPMNEREKYQKIWALGGYGDRSPGEVYVDAFLDVAKPDGMVIDLGCGTGRGAKAIAEKTGLPVLLIDFTDNCRDKLCLGMPFVQWDLTTPLPVSAPYGYCSDVMEHIPEADVARVIANAQAACGRVWYQISTVGDNWGRQIGQRLHCTVRSHEWWAAQFSGYRIEHQEMFDQMSRFYVTAAEASSA